MREQRRKFKATFAVPTVTVAPSCGGAFDARVVEALGFDAIHLSGQAVHKSLGLADAGLITLSELEARTAQINEAVDLPVIVDGETGFGNQRNIKRAVRLLERAGASAIHFEDQVTPRRYRDGGVVPVISQDEMIAKLKAALDAREDPNMLIIARSEERSSKEAMIERLLTYAKTGVDGLWTSAYDHALLGQLRAATGLPFLGVPTDRLIKQETADAGVHAMIFPTIPTVAMAWGLRTVLTKMRESGSDEAYRTIEGLDETRKWFRTLGENRYS
jgi:2-methylisocitrate lyase-like PEP mutase family enzyme